MLIIRLDGIIDEVYIITRLNFVRNNLIKEHVQVM